MDDRSNFEIPGAQCYEVEFDPRCSTERNRDVSGPPAIVLRGKGEGNRQGAGEKYALLPRTPTSP